MYQDLFIPVESFVFKSSNVSKRFWATDFDVRFLPAMSESVADSVGKWKWSVAESSKKDHFDVKAKKGFSTLREAKQDFIQTAKKCLPSQDFESSDFKLYHDDLSTYSMYAPDYHEFISSPHQSVLRTEGQSSQWYMHYGKTIMNGLLLSYSDCYAKTRKQALIKAQKIISSNLEGIYHKSFPHIDYYYQAQEEIYNNTWKSNILLKERLVSEYAWWLMLIKPEVDLPSILNK